jgi:cytochrome P450
MINLFSEQARRDPYPLYDQLRRESPALLEPVSGLWMVFDYDGVKRLLSDQEYFSSRHGPAEWLIFQDPPRHSKLRALISKAFTPKSVVGLEGRIRSLTRQLLDPIVERGEMDLATEFAVPLPMRVIAEMLGIPPSDQARFMRWNDVILEMSYTVTGGAGAETAMAQFIAATGEMHAYLTALLRQRRAAPRDDLLTRLATAEVDGERLTDQDILGFFQLLLLAGSETTTNLINNAILCFIDHPDQLALLRARPDLLPSAIEEVLRFRSPLQWMYRLTRRETTIDGASIPAGKLVLAMIGSANRDPRAFPAPDRFDITRDPNPHLAFGHGLHFCLGAPLARLEARIALADLLSRMNHIRPASDAPWEPRKGLHVHGPTRLPIRFEPNRPVRLTSWLANVKRVRDIPLLLIRLKKNADGTGSLSCTRADGSVTWQRQRSGVAQFFARHDLTHYAVERVLRHRRGFYGLLADGWDFTDFGDEQPRKAFPPDMDPSELIVGFFDAEHYGRDHWDAAKFNEYAATYYALHGVSSAPPLITAEQLARVREVLRDLLEKWDAVEPGDALELPFDVT